MKYKGEKWIYYSAQTLWNTWISKWNVFSTLIQFIHELAPGRLWFLIDTAYREPYQTVSTVYFIIVVLRARVEVGSQKPEVGRPFSAFVVSSCIWIKVQINVQTTQHFQFNSLESRAQGVEIPWWFDVTSKTKQTVQETCEFIQSD